MKRDPKPLKCCKGRTQHGGPKCEWPGEKIDGLTRPYSRIKVKDVPSKGKSTDGFSRPLRDIESERKHFLKDHPLSFSLKDIPISESVGRKFLRMTLAERTKFVELFAGFGEKEWRSFRRWIRKLGGK